MIIVIHSREDSLHFGFGEFLKKPGKDDTAPNYGMHRGKNYGHENMAK